MIKAKSEKNGELLNMKRRQICRGAMKVLRKKKFYAASMREIADRELYHAAMPGGCSSFLLNRGDE